VSHKLVGGGKIAFVTPGPVTHETTGSSDVVRLDVIVEQLGVQKFMPTSDTVRSPVTAVLPIDQSRSTCETGSTHGFRASRGLHFRHGVVLLHDWKLLLRKLLLWESSHCREVYVALFRRNIEGHACMLLDGEVVVRHAVTERACLAVATSQRHGWVVLRVDEGGELAGGMPIGQIRCGRLAGTVAQGALFEP
jgi:hypothetical protein